MERYQAGRLVVVGEAPDEHVVARRIKDLGRGRFHELLPLIVREPPDVRSALEVVVHRAEIRGRVPIRNEALARADLTYRIVDPFPAAYERLRTDFNGAVDGLQQAIATIAANTGAINAGAAEIAKAADDLSRRTEQQASSLQETAASMEQMTATVSQSAETAQAPIAVSEREDWAGAPRLRVA